MRSRGAVFHHRRALQLVKTVDDLRQRLIDRLGSGAGGGGMVFGRRPQALEVLAERPDQVAIDAPALE